MNHAKNERIARNLRAMADMIEKSPQEFSASIKAHGGESRFYVLHGREIPTGFGPIGATLIIGDEGFVKSHAVIAIDPGRN